MAALCSLYPDLSQNDRMTERKVRLSKGSAGVEQWQLSGQLGIQPELVWQFITVTARLE